LAQRHEEITQAGARVVGVSVDPPERNAAMIEKLRLPFPLLSDPEGQGAIRPYDVWHDEQSVALPAVVVLDRGGGELLRQVGEDVADRLDEDDLLAALRQANLPAVTQQPPARGAARPGPDAVELVWLPWFFRGAKTALAALAGRTPEARQQARRMRKGYDRFLEALDWFAEQR
jgi:hypothetical protein